MGIPYVKLDFFWSNRQSDYILFIFSNIFLNSSSNIFLNIFQFFCVFWLLSIYLFKFLFTLFFKPNLVTLCKNFDEISRKTFLTLNCLSRKNVEHHFISLVFKKCGKMAKKNLVLSINFIDFLERWCRSLEFTVYVTIEKCWK